MAGFADLLGGSVDDRIHAFEVARGQRQAAQELSHLPYNLNEAAAPAQAMPYIPNQDVAMQLLASPAPQRAPQGFQDVVAPQAQAPAAPPAPPASPEEAQARVQGWKEVLGGMMSSPEGKQVMLQMGLRLLQGRQPYQSKGSFAADVIGTGLQTDSMLKENAIAKADKAREQGMQDRDFDQRQRKGELEIATASEDLDFAKLTRGDKILRLKQELANLKAQGRMDEARAIAQEMENGNFDKAWALKVKETNSEIAARATNARTNRMIAERPTAAQQKTQATRDLVMEANPQQPGESPEAYKQRVAQITIDINQSAKVNEAQTYLDLADAAETDEERAGYLDLARQAVAKQQKGRPGVAAPVTGAPKRFSTMAEAIAAKKTGKIKPGDTISIGGRTATVD